MYSTIIRNGKVKPMTPLELPEGSAIYIVVQPKLDQRTARKKATGWLVDHVGNLVMADDGTLAQKGPRWVWRFNVYMTSLMHKPRGPIGQVELNAETGAILNDQDTITMMYERGQQFIHTTALTN
jgi:hypothetical protein